MAACDINCGHCILVVLCLYCSFMYFNSFKWKWPCRRHYFGSILSCVSHTISDVILANRYWHKNFNLLIIFNFTKKKIQFTVWTKPGRVPASYNLSSADIDTIEAASEPRRALEHLISSKDLVVATRSPQGEVRYCSECSHIKVSYF